MTYSEYPSLGFGGFLKLRACSQIIHEIVLGCFGIFHEINFIQLLGILQIPLVTMESLQVPKVPEIFIAP